MWRPAPSVRRTLVWFILGEGPTSKLAIQSYCILRKSELAACSRPLAGEASLERHGRWFCTSAGYCPIHDVKDRTGGKRFSTNWNIIRTYASSVKRRSSIGARNGRRRQVGSNADRLLVRVRFGTERRRQTRGAPLPRSARTGLLPARNSALRDSSNRIKDDLDSEELGHRMLDPCRERPIASSALSQVASNLASGRQ